MRRMRTTFKRLTSVLLSAAISLSMIPAALANPTESFVDFPTGWSKPAMEAAVANGLLYGMGNNTIAPKSNLTRAEMAAVMVRAFGAETVADISAFADVSGDAWYYDSIAKAVKMGAMAGKSSTQMDPQSNITREEMISVLARILALSNSDTSSLAKFHDAWDVAEWAKQGVAAMVARGYVSGDDNGNLNPKGYITREEFAQLMYATICTYVTKDGIYESDVPGIAVVRTGNLTLRNMTVTRDLVIGDGAMQKPVLIQNVKIEGRLLTRGGTITVAGATTTGEGVVVLNPNGITKFNNYRIEPIFSGIIEHTPAQFLIKTSGGGSSGGGSFIPSVNTFAVTFVVKNAGGQILTTIPVAHVTKNEPIGAALPATVEVLGYRFGGWVDGNGAPVTSATVVSSDMTIYADMQKVTYRIQFNDIAEARYNPDPQVPRYVTYDVDNFGNKISTATAQNELDMPAGKEFDYWKQQGDAGNTKVLDSIIAVNTTYMPANAADNTVTLVLEPVLKLKKYTVKFEVLKDTEWEQTIADIENVEHGSTLGTLPTVPQIDGWEFDKWEYYNGTNFTEFTGATPVTDNITVVAKMKPRVIVERNYIGGVNGTYYVEKGIKVEDFLNDPNGDTNTSDSIKTPAVTGYTYGGKWLYADGSVVQFATDEIDRPITIKPDLTLNKYKVVFNIKDADYANGVRFKNSDAKFIEMEYDYENWQDSDKAFPTAEDLILPPDLHFAAWKDGDEQVAALALKHIFAQNGDKLELTAEITGNKLVYLTFYDSYGDDEDIIGQKQGYPLINGEANVSAIPTGLDKIVTYLTKSLVLAPKSRNVNFFQDFSNFYAAKPDEDDNIDVDETFWYEKNGKLVPFETPITITEDTKVYRLTKNIAFNVNLEAMPNVNVAPYAEYGNTSRVLDTSKILAVRLRDVVFGESVQQLPQYNELLDTVYGKIEEKDLIDENKNIKVSKIPLKISQVVTESVANGMVKQYLRDMVKDEAKLDTILNMTDVNELINIVGIDKIVQSMGDESILALLKADANRTIVTQFIVDELQKGTESVLRPEVLKYMNIELAKDESTIRDNMSVQVKTVLGGDSTSSANIRKMILTGDALDTIITNAKVKAEVIKLVLDTDSGFIDAILADETLAKKLIEEISHYPKFIDSMVNTKQFKDYVEGRIHIGGADYQIVVDALKKSDAVHNAIVTRLHNDTQFKNILTNDKNIRDEVVNSISIESDIIKYIFDQKPQYQNMFDYKALVDWDTKEAYVASQYALENYGAEDDYQGLMEYNNMSYNAKMAAKEKLYNNTAVITRTYAKLAGFSDTITQYKEQTLDAFIGGTLTNPDLTDMIEKQLVQYVIYWLDKSPKLDKDIGTMVQTHVLSYIAELIINPLPTGADEQLKKIKNTLDKDMDEFIAEGHKNPEVVAIVKNFVDTHNDSDMTAIISGVYADVAPTLAGHIKTIDQTGTSYTALDTAVKNAAADLDTTVVSELIKDNISDASITGIVEEYISDSNNEAEIKGYVDTFIGTLTVQFIKDYRATIDVLIKTFDVNELIEKGQVDIKVLAKDYLKSLNDTEKQDFADSVYTSVIADSAYKNLMNSLLKNDTFEINKSNKIYVQALNSAIRDLTIDEAIAFTHNANVEKLVDLIGKDYVSQIYNKARNEYCDGLDEKIALVTDTNSEKYTTSLTFAINAVDFLDKMYVKALPKAKEKLENAGIYAADNEYMQYLVNHDTVGMMFKSAGNGSDDLTGYALHDELHYYNYMLHLMILTDDMLCWYGEKLSDKQYQDLYDAVFVKVYIVHEKLNEIMKEYRASGNLPSQVETVLNRVQKLNSLFLKFEPQIQSVIDRYLASGVNGKLENETFDDEEKVQTAIDILLGKDDPTFTIDCLYDIFYAYDDKMIAKLGELVDSGKLRKAIDKFAATDIGAKLVGKVGDERVEQLYNIIVDISKYGIDRYRDDTSADPTVVDSYTIQLGGNKFTLSRSLK